MRSIRYLLAIAIVPTMAFGQARSPQPHHVPFLVFDLAGGAALPGNFLVGKAGGPHDLMKSYDLQGWNPRVTSLDTRFGLPMADRSVSKILDGMLSIMSSGAQANLRLASVINWSDFDTETNYLSALALVSAAGNHGSLFANGVGLYPTLSGGNSRAAGEGPDTKTLQVNQLKDLTTISSAMLDPRTDAAAQTIYGISANTSDFDRRVLIGAIVENVLARNTGPGAIVIEGCDYHTGDQTTGDQKDFEIGQEIGRAVELAHQKGTPLFFQIITDGGIVADPGTRNWNADSYESMTVIGYFSPVSPIAYVNNQIQLGAYTDAQTVDRATIVGGEPALAAYSSFANYLNVIGQLDQFDGYAPGVFGEQLNQTLLFDVDQNLGLRAKK
jgi:hypothetical protein